MEKELRIGNYVNGTYEDYSENEDGESKTVLCKILGVDSTSSLGDGWTFLVESVDESYEEFYEDFLPIELTPEWLLKGNCQKVNNSTYRKGAFTFQPVHATVDGSNDIMDKVLKSKKGFRVCLSGNFICNLFYVHDWQNLHFALSKTELKFIAE